MKKEYDFSKAEKGKFYQGNNPVDITINLDNPQDTGKYEVFHDDQGLYHFRLKTPSNKIIVTSNPYSSKDDCLKAIQIIQQTAFASQTVEL